MKKLLFSFLLGIALMSVQTTNAQSQSELISNLKAGIASLQYQLPIEVGNGTTLTAAKFVDNTKTAVYRYQFVIDVPKPTVNELKERKLGIIHLLKSQPNSDDMKLLRAGVTFHYNYYTPSNVFMYSIKITPADVR